MGRKIPGRKHRGVRDIEKQKRTQLLSIKDRINAPPVNPDEQHVPKSLSRLIELKDKVKSGEISLKRKRKHRGQPGPITSHPNGVRQRFHKSGRPEKPTPVYTQNPGESDERFKRRIDKICSTVIKEAAFEDKYRIDVRRNAHTGEVESIKRRKQDELTVLMKQARRNNQKQKGGKKKTDPIITSERLTKSQKWQAKLKERKLRRTKLRADDSKSASDHVKFGEVVHAPPTLSAPRKASSSGETPRPGRKDLLLKSIMENGKEIDVVMRRPSTVGKLRSKTVRVIDRKAKRKDLPHALRRQLETQQTDVIKAYKLLKSKKYNSRK